MLRGVVLTRWLLIVLLVSVGALLVAALAGARHIWRQVWRQRRLLNGASEPGVGEAEAGEARNVGKGDE